MATRAESRAGPHGGPRRSAADALRDLAFKALFKGLVYPQIWEDPEVDLEALQITPDCHVLTIASGGCNVLSYLTSDPAHITARPALAPGRRAGGLTSCR